MVRCFYYLRSTCPKARIYTLFKFSRAIPRSLKVLECRPCIKLTIAFSFPESQTMEAQLKTVVSRLENLASRFEAICPKGSGGDSRSTVASASGNCLPDPPARLITLNLYFIAWCSFKPDSPIVRSFDEIFDGPVAQFLSLSSSIGGDVDQMVSSLR